MPSNVVRLSSCLSYIYPLYISIYKELTTKLRLLLGKYNFVNQSSSQFELATEFRPPFGKCQETCHLYYDHCISIETVDRLILLQIWCAPWPRGLPLDIWTTCRLLPNIRDARRLGRHIEYSCTQRCRHLGASNVLPE